MSKMLSCCLAFGYNVRMEHVIDQVGGASVVADLCRISAPSVTNWKRRGIPFIRCAAIERATEGKWVCEQLRPDVSWCRIADPLWPWHPSGRPALDLTRQLEQAGAGPHEDTPPMPSRESEGLFPGQIAALPAGCAEAQELHEQARPTACVGGGRSKTGGACSPDIEQEAA